MDPARVVFVDATWASPTMARRTGRSPRGEPLVMPGPHGHWTTTPVVAGPTAAGMVAPVVIDGAVTGDLVVASVEQQLAPGLRPGDVVVMDTLACHKRAGVRAAIATAGADRRLLPADRPDLNPIALAFATLKRLLRSAGHRTIPALERFRGDAMDAFAPAERAADIRHCGYGATGK